MINLIRRVWHDLPLASKIAIFASVLVVLIVPTLTILTIQRERESFRNDLEAQAGLLLDTLSQRLVDPLINEQVTKIVEIAQDLVSHAEITRFKVYNKNGVLKVDAAQLDKGIPTDANPLHPGTLSQAVDKPVFYWDGELVAEMGVWTKVERVGFVQMGFSTAPLDERIRVLAEWSFTVTVIALLFGILLATFVARQLTNPISELIRTANKMASGDLRTRFQPRGSDEIGQLGRAFNDLAGAIEKRETDLRSLARNLEQRVKERTRELQQQNQYLAALHEVTLGLIENLDPERLLEAIMTRAASLAGAEHAFVTIVDPERNEMQLRVAQGGYRTQLGMWTRLTQGLSGRVFSSGQMIIEKDYQLFEDKHPDFVWLRTAIYVPLRFEASILGVIGLGYDRVVEVNSNHVDILNQFAQLASLALKNAQLYSATQQELTETEQALLVEEDRRKAYLISPQGRAESMAGRILKDPVQALAVMHDLAQKADQDANAALLAELPGMLELEGHTLLAQLAEGYHFIYRSSSEPELLAVGLRQLATGLDLPEARDLLQAEEAAAIYGLCRQAMDAGSIHAIAELLPSLQALQAKNEIPAMFAGLVDALRALLPMAESLHSYERVDSTEDRRDYLARAFEALNYAERLVNGLYAAERPIVRRIRENWMALVTLSMSDLQTRAQISYRLISRNSWKDKTVAVALKLHNQGHGLAVNLRVSLGVYSGFLLTEERIEVDHLGPGEETQVEFHVKPQLQPERDQFRASFTILYDDPCGPNHMDHFADIVHLLATEPAFQLIPNPYVAGTPLEAGSPLFYGREDLFDYIGEVLNAAHRNNLVLIGQRRTGKSSLLKQLPLQLGEEFLPVYLDGQSIALDPGLPAFFSNLAMEIGYALQDRGFECAIPQLEAFSERPAFTFEHEFLRQVRTVIGKRHLVLLLDEFEELESAARRGNLDASIFGFLRHLIQHESGLSVIFCGTHRMEELATDYWSVLFNISLYKHVGFLEYEEAVRLVQEPVAAFGMCYDDLALEKMWRITAGHPYFLQLLCHSLVNLHNRTNRSYVTISDVNAALDEILSTGEAHFVYLWNESSRTERQVLTALSRMMTLTGHVMPVQVDDYLNERGISLGRQVIAETLHHLTLRDILAGQADSAPTGTASSYGWRLGLLGLWIEKFKSLSLIQEEAGP